MSRKTQTVLETDNIRIRKNKKANTFVIESKLNQSGIPEASWEELQIMAQAILNHSTKEFTR